MEHLKIKKMTKRQKHQSLLNLPPENFFHIFSFLMDDEYCAEPSRFHKDSIHNATLIQSLHSSFSSQEIYSQYFHSFWWHAFLNLTGLKEGGSDVNEIKTALSQENIKRCMCLFIVARGKYLQNRMQNATDGYRIVILGGCK